MIRNLLIAFALTLAAVTTVSAQEFHENSADSKRYDIRNQNPKNAAKSTKKTEDEKKFSLKFGGRIDAMAFYDTNNSNVEMVGGLLYFAPDRPTLDATTGSVINNPDLLRFSISATRVHVAADYNYGNGLKMGGFIETDFINTTSAYGSVPGIRLRQAYGYIAKNQSHFLFGQTSHLAHVETILPPTVTFAAGYPINVISRPVQLRYTHDLCDQKLQLSGALSMFYGSQNIAQAQGLIPDISLRLLYDNHRGFSFAAFGGFKSLQPEHRAVADKTERMNSAYGGVVARGIFGRGYTLSGMAVFGGDMTTMGMIGGYAPLQDLKGYAPINTLSAWLDFSTPRYSGFSFGLFLGYQDNLGAMTDILASEIQGADLYKGLDHYWRVAPRMWYAIHKFSFGLEYMYSQAQWMHQWDSKYQSAYDLPAAQGSRITLLCRFTF